MIPGGEVFINTVGTLGIASASYLWSLVAALWEGWPNIWLEVGRLAHCLVGGTATTWHMLAADDYLLECGGVAYRRGLLTFFVLCAALVFLSGDVLVWVGFELLLRSRGVGISASRADWFARWTQSISESDTVPFASFERVLAVSCS